MHTIKSFEIQEGSTTGGKNMAALMQGVVMQLNRGEGRADVYIIGRLAFIRLYNDKTDEIYVLVSLNEQGKYAARVLRPTDMTQYQLSVFAGLDEIAGEGEDE